MKLTIHEMIFQMHLEKQSYDKAVDEMEKMYLICCGFSFRRFRKP